MHTTVAASHTSHAHRYFTPLMHAVQGGQLACVHTLLEARADMETQLDAKHGHTTKQLHEEIARYEEKNNKLEAKLKFEQEKRASLEVELHSSRVEIEQHRAAASSSDNEVNCKVAEILALLDTSPQTCDIESDSGASNMEILRSRVAKLLSLFIKVNEEKNALETHLEQYKAKTGAATSSAKLMSVISTRESNDPVPQDQLVQMLQENADGLSQLQTELDMVTAEKERVEADSKLLAEALRKSQTELNGSLGQNLRSQNLNTAAQALYDELLGELTRARSCSWPESSPIAEEL